MSKTLSKRSASVAALCAVLASSVALPFSAFAQNSDGGFLMKLRVAERFISRESDGPDLEDNSTTNQAITDVRLSISSETRTEALTFDIGGGYRFIDGPGSDGYEGEFTDPNVRLAYSQETVASSIQVTAFASRTDLDNQATLDVAQGTDGTLDPDFADLTQDGGTRDRLSFQGRLTLRDDAPFGLAFTLNVDDYSYNNLPDDSTLNDFSSARLGASARFDINEVTQANLGLYISQTDDSEASTINRYGIDAGLILTQPNGQITLDLSASASNDDGDQLHLSAGRSYTLEYTTATFELGLSQATNDDIFATGSASLEHAFADDSPWGTFTASADRRLTREGRSDEDLVTSLSVATNYTLSPVAGLNLSASYAQSEDVLTGDTVDLSQANLSVSYALTPDWSASAGIGVQSRDPSGSSATDSTTLSLGLSRNFDLRR